MEIDKRFAAVVGLAAGLGVASCDGDDLVGPEVVSVPARVSAGLNLTCAVGTDALVRCWGDNRIGQLGHGVTTAEYVSTPTAVTGGRQFLAVGTGSAGRHVCGVTNENAAYCWGRNDFGQLGDATLNDSSEPVVVSGGLAFASVSANWRFSCAVTVRGAGYCWGRGELGQLGNGGTTNSTVPVEVGGGHTFETIQVGSNSIVCGLTTAGDVYCWGLNLYGEVGAPTSEQCVVDSGSFPCATGPVRVPIDLEFRAVSTGHSYACATATIGSTFCWGLNGSRQLGAESAETCSTSTPCSGTPLEVEGIPSLIAVSAGGSHACGVTSRGEAYCWGSNTLGQLGDGRAGVERSEPVLVSGDLALVAVTAGFSHTCGQTTSGDLYCWGMNDFGQLGDGTTDFHLTPTKVAGGA